MKRESICIIIVPRIALNGRVLCIQLWHFHEYGYVIQVISGAVSLSGIAMHIFTALIFIYDVFAFALSQILKIINLKSDVWYYTKISLV